MAPRKTTPKAPPVLLNPVSREVLVELMVELQESADFSGSLRPSQGRVWFSAIEQFRAIGQESNGEGDLSDIAHQAATNGSADSFGVLPTYSTE